MYTLGIETSCDETSCAVLKNDEVLSNVTISSLNEHKRYGGVIPEIATRAHLSTIDTVLAQALKKAGVSLAKIDLVAVTSKPGLIGALVVGVNFAKGLAYALGKPFLGVNHLHAHLFAPFLNRTHTLSFPFLGVVVSGGHTHLYRVNDFTDMKIVGQTRDDACGEVYDKVAKAYGLGYPGGPLIDKLFDPRHTRAFPFKCGRIGFDTSFSGIKTALMYERIELEKKGVIDRKTKVKILSSFQAAVVDTLVQTVREAALQYNLKRVVCGGGVSANAHLREQLMVPDGTEKTVILSPLCYTGDNAAIVAGLGFYLYNKHGATSPLSLQAKAH